MKLQEIAKQLSNRINQEHYVMQYLEKIRNVSYKKGYEDGKAEQSTQPLFINGVMPRVSHFVSDIGQKYPATDEAVLIEIEGGILRFYELGYDFERIYLNPVYVVEQINCDRCESTKETESICIDCLEDLR
jgi:hypothetical protein